MINPSSLERFYLGQIEVSRQVNGTLLMTLKKTSTDDIQFRFDTEGIRNRSELMHPHLLHLKRFLVDQRKVKFL